MKHETRIVKYGAQSGMSNGKYGITCDGTLASYDRTYKTKQMAELKALEFAQHVHSDFYQEVNSTYYHFEFVLENK